MFDLFLRDAVYRTDCILIVLFVLVSTPFWWGQYRQWRSFRKKLRWFESQADTYDFIKFRFRMNADAIEDGERILALRDLSLDLNTLVQAYQRERYRLVVLSIHFASILIVLLLFLLVSKSYIFVPPTIMVR